MTQPVKLYTVRRPAHGSIVWGCDSVPCDTPALQGMGFDKELSILNVGEVTLAHAPGPETFEVQRVQ